MKFDIYVAQKIANLLDKYLLYRQKNKITDWDSLFKNDKLFFEILLSGNIKFNLYKDSVLCKLIFNGFEEKEQLFITKFLKLGDTFFDIGANIGLHSLVAAEILKKDGHVYSFEPSRKTFERLQQSILINNFSETITGCNVGVSNKREKLILNESANGHDAWNSFAQMKHVSLPNKIEVETYRLDDFIKDKNITINDISLIKIDVEGWELMVLVGLDKLLDDADFNPCFMIEFTEENIFSAGYSSKELYNYLLDRGYAWFEYDGLSNTVSCSPLKAYYPYENLIAIKSNNLENLKKRLSSN